MLFNKLAVIFNQRFVLQSGPRHGFLILSLIIICEGTKVARELNLEDGPPYSSVDTFENSGYCSAKRRLCTSRGAECSSSCCICRCRSNSRNFYSYDEGCVNSDGLFKLQETQCSFILKTSGSLYIPTFSHANDFSTADLELDVKSSSTFAISGSSICKSQEIHYVDSDGKRKTLFENKCSEVIGISSQMHPDGKYSHKLKWTYLGNTAAVWSKMKGKLMQIDIVCQSSKMNKTFSSCLLFKVAGRYFSGIRHSVIKTIVSCPTLVTTTKADVTITSEVTTNKKQRTMSPSDNKTSISLATWPIFTSKKTKTVYAPTVAPTDKPSNQGFSDKTGNRNRSDGLIIGLTIAIAFLVVILAAALFVLMKKRCRKQRLLKQRAAYSKQREDVNLNRQPSMSASEDNVYETIEPLIIGASNHATNCDRLKRSNVETAKQRSNDNKYTDCYQPSIKQKHEYAMPVQKAFCETHAHEEYADMSHGRTSETLPLVDSENRYENVGAGSRRPSAQPLKNNTKFNEDVNATGCPTTKRVVVEAYVLPEVNFKGV